MKRPPRGDQSAFSLFPFLAVLLCTMGTMVVLLVAMAEVARQRAKHKAEQIAAAQRLADESDADQAAERARLEERIQAAADALAELDRLHALGEKSLSEAQAHLSDIEDHVRRLRDAADALRVEAQELIVIEGEHDADLKTARAELERLEQLVLESESDIAALRERTAERQRSYAIVALRDNASGTNRPPFYVECTEEGLLIQPDEVLLPWEDLVAPQFGNPLAAAERAVARYYSEHPEARAANEAGRPYPLLVVRPEGVSAYYRARDALGLAKVDFGYQPIGADWPLEYGSPDPVRRRWIEEAVSDARSERRGLVRINPRFAAAVATAEANAHAIVASRGEGQGGDGAGNANLRVSRGDADPNNPFRGLRIAGAPEGNADGSDPAGSEQSTRERLAGPRGGAPTPGFATDGLAGGPASSPDNAQNESPGQLAPTTAQPSASLALAGPSNGGAPSEAGSQLADAAGGSSGDQGSAGPRTGMPPRQGSPTGEEASQAVQANVRPPQDYGDVPGVPGVPRRELPIVRPVSLYVAEDWVSIVGERGVPVATTPFRGPSHQNVNDLLATLEKYAESWGIAGSGMYWDPRVVMRVAPDGSTRAKELQQLLQAAGLKLRNAETASRPGGTDAQTR